MCIYSRRVKRRKLNLLPNAYDNCKLNNFVVSNDVVLQQEERDKKQPFFFFFLVNIQLFRSAQNTYDTTVSSEADSYLFMKKTSFEVFVKKKIIITRAQGFRKNDDGCLDKHTR